MCNANALQRADLRFGCFFCGRRKDVDSRGDDGSAESESESESERVKG